MTSAEFVARLRDRVAKAESSVSDVEVAALETYFRLLARWNTTINLTVLPLSEPTDETFDRLFVEPIRAAQFVKDDGQVWFDLGSGGGSPALPLKICRPTLRLTMVESKTRKAAFLREAIRELGLQGADVIVGRFEDLPSRRDAGLVTVRAVRPDANLFLAASRLLCADGQLVLFRSGPDELEPMGFVRTAGTPSLAVFHVEQSR